MLESALGHCLNAVQTAGPFASVAVALFVAGLLGGFAHCSLMCGPFVLMQTARALDAVPASRMRESHRLRAALLLPYHLGRMTTYAGLGAAMAFFVGGLSAQWQTISAILLGLAGLSMVLSIALPALAQLPVPAALSRLHARLLRFVAPAPTAFPRPLDGYRLGLVLGLLPCGMVYAALLAAAGTGSAWQGAASMAVFALGTAPGLMAAGLAGRFALTRLRVRAGPLARAGSVITGLWLCVVSFSLLMR